MASTFHHVHLICSDLDDTERFFVEALGARRVERTSFGGTEGSKLTLGDTGIFLRLPHANEKVDAAGARPCFGYHHIGVLVDDLEVSHRDLEARGFVFRVLPRHTPNGSLAFLEGPDGILVELYQPSA